MSRHYDEFFDSGNAPKEWTSTSLDGPQPAQLQTPTGESNFTDSSDPLFAMYNEISREEDEKMAESWKADADAILIFTGLFSAAVATLVATSIKDLRPNPQDTSAFYLRNIYDILADPNTPNVPTPPTLTDPPRFSPPRHAVWVNSLWFLSLAVGLTCGLLATFLGQWARRYLKVIQSRSSPHKRARIRAFFAEGVDQQHLPLAVKALPFLSQLSLSLFFAGLLVLLFNTDHAVFGTVAGWVGFCVAIYVYVTFIPVFRQDSPYSSPLSSPAWSLLNGIVFTVIRTLFSSKILDRVGFSIRDRMINLAVASQRRFVGGVDNTAKDTALKISSEIDARALMWAFDSVDEDYELERFFSGIPGFCSSRVVSNPFDVFIEPYKWKLSDELVRLMHRTLTSNLISASVRKRRSLNCTRAMHAASLSVRPYICEEIINGGWDGLLNYVEFGYFIRTNHDKDPSMAYYSTCMVAIVIATVKEREELWFELALGHLDVSAPALRDYLAHGDSVLLANYIRVLRDIIHVHFEHFQSGDAASRWKVLESVSRFDIQDTLPTLQHDFCDLWNEIIHRAGTTPDHRIRSIHIALLKNARGAYIALHKGTDSASRTDDEHVLFLLSSYPVCDIPDHHPRPASRVYDALVDTTARTYPSASQIIVLPSSPSSYAPENPQIYIDSHQPPLVTTPTLSSAPASPAQGVANASIMTSTSSLAVAQSTKTAATTFISLAHTTSSNPANRV